MRIPPHPQRVLFSLGASKLSPMRVFTFHMTEWNQFPGLPDGDSDSEEG